MTQTISDTFITESGPTGGAQVYGYLASRFTTPPVLNSLPPGGPGANAGPVETGANFGGPGEFRIVLPTNEPYYLSFSYNGQLSWKYYGAALLTDQEIGIPSGTITLAASLQGNSKQAKGFADATAPTDLATYRQVQLAHGSQGPQGEQGPQGADSTVPGPQGFQGTQGAQGEQGTQGFQGDDGPQGPQGFQGLRGLQGNQGNQGFQGNNGPQGTQGFQGFQGYQSSVPGPQGNQGIAGNGVGAQGDYTGLLPQNYASSHIDGVQGRYVTQAWTIPPDVVSGTTTAFNSGSLYAWEFVMPITATVTAIQCRTQGVASSLTSAYVGIYDWGADGAGSFPLATSTNVAVAFISGSTLKTIQLVTPVQLIGGSKYAIGAIWSGNTTNLSLVAGGNQYFNNLNMSPLAGRLTLRAGYSGTGLIWLPDVSTLPAQTPITGVAFWSLVSPA